MGGEWGFEIFQISHLKGDHCGWIECSIKYCSNEIRWWEIERQRRYIFNLFYLFICWHLCEMFVEQTKLFYLKWVFSKRTREREREREAIIPNLVNLNSGHDPLCLARIVVASQCFFQNKNQKKKEKEEYGFD